MYNIYLEYMFFTHRANDKELCFTGYNEIQTFSPWDSLQTWKESDFFLDSRFLIFWGKHSNVILFQGKGFLLRREILALFFFITLMSLTVVKLDSASISALTIFVQWKTYFSMTS